ncbi:MAG TPA: choice-of-anchor Q domain-containing protein, partial [Pyrinomonadaceae bacterium]|nr:choice-of-anchor Q domain-containing protein [Pyrinomonadaceae bacterium]
ACNSTGNGGGIYVQNGNLIFQNSTLALNTATLSGGGLYINNAGATATISSSTIAQNNATQSGAGVAVTNGTVNSRNSIYSNFSADFAGTMNSLGYNLIKNTAGSTITGTTTGNLLNVEPLLFSLNSNGGYIQTYETNLMSPAIDAGDPSLTNTTDQRRARRNTDGNFNGVAGVDIGAFEKQKPSFDFDAEGSSDLAVTRIVSGTNLSWYAGIRVLNNFQGLLNPTPNGLSVQQFGLSTDISAPGDYDGDGQMDAAVYRPSEGIWYIFGSTSG